MTHFLKEYEKEPPNRLEGDKMPMKNITINIPDTYDDLIQKLIKMKITPSRSEAIRTALREFLSKEFKNIELMDSFLKEKIE